METVSFSCNLMVYFTLPQITLLDSAVNHLKVNLKSAADLIGLPTTVEELQKVKPKEAGIEKMVLNDFDN